MQYVTQARKSFVRTNANIQSAPKTLGLFSSREMGKRLSCLPVEVESELKLRGLSYHKNSGGLLWQVWSDAC